MLKPIFKFSFIYFLGLIYVVYQADLQLAKSYPTNQQNKPITVIGTIVSLPEQQASSVRLNFAIEEVLDPIADDIKPGLVRINWQKNKIVQIGDRWQLTLRLKKPRRFANPGSFDIERHFFSQRIIATGYVDTRKPQRKYHRKKLLALAYSLRQYLGDGILGTLKENKFVGTVLALTIGMQDKITAHQWAVFRGTGTAHLLVISGLHVGFIAGLIFFLATSLWRRMPIICLRIPAPWVGACSSVLAACAYAFLAGFSVSTKRACIMIIVAMAGILYRRIITPVSVFSSALLIVLLLDPLVIFSISFWLSFTIVGIFLYAFVGRAHAPGVMRWLKPQIVGFLGMLPLLLASFGQVSLLAPLANIIAIPVVSLLIVPLALLGVILYLIWQASGAAMWVLTDNLLQLLWVVLEKIHKLSWANWEPMLANPWYIVFAIVGVLWLLAPRGFPGKIFGACGLLPLLLPLKHVVPYGEAIFTLLDVGQGLAAVIETNHHALVYDTGPRFNAFDTGEYVVWPFLKTRGINRLDKLIISHADLDHSGGMRSLLTHIESQQIITSLPVRLNRLGIPESSIENISSCKAGQRWEWDGVLFEILHPARPMLPKYNEQSCVLRVRALNGSSVLLTGDIEHRSEKQLIARYSSQLGADILLVPHHGSRTSSTQEFIKQVNPEYAVISVGYLNKFGHPKPQVIANYQKSGVKLLSTIDCGAISFNLGNLGAENRQLNVNCYRIEHRRFWHEY